MVWINEGLIPKQVCTWMDKMDYHCITSEDGLIEMEKSLLESGDVFSVDTETSSDDCHTCKLAGYSICAKQGTAYYVPVGHRLGINCPQVPALHTLQRIAKNHLVIMFNAKYDFRVLQRHGVIIDKFEDPFIFSKLECIERNEHGLKALAREFLKTEMLEIRQLFLEDLENIVIDFTRLNPQKEAVYRYACADADMGLRIRKVMHHRVEGMGLTKMIDLEHRVIKPVLEIEETGFPVDIAGCSAAEVEINSKLIPLTEEILAEFAKYRTEDEIKNKVEFNLDSDDHLRDYLFKRMKWPVQAETEKEKKPKVDKDSLKKLANLGYALARKLLNYSEWKKRLNDFVLKIPTMLHDDGRIRTELDQFGAVSGRFSSKKPNMQQMPSKGEGKKVRSIFKAPEGYYLLAIDYSQIEYRLFASMSGEQSLIDAFMDGEDYHSKTSAMMFNIPIDKVAKKQRDQGKTINFCLIYGGTEHALSSLMEIPLEEAAELKNKYFKAMPKAKRWLEEMERKALDTGEMRTLYGRLRRIQNIKQLSKGRQHGMARSLVNSRIQGTAADICKYGMVNLWEYKENKYPDIKMALQVHDEVILFVPNHYTDHIGLAQELASVFEWSDPQLVVPIKCDVEYGLNWGEAEEIVKGAVALREKPAPGTVPSPTFPVKEYIPPETLNIHAVSSEHKMVAVEEVDDFLDDSPEVERVEYVHGILPDPPYVLLRYAKASELDERLIHHLIIQKLKEVSGEGRVKLLLSVPLTEPGISVTLGGNNHLPRVVIHTPFNLTRSMAEGMVNYIKSQDFHAELIDG